MALTYPPGFPEAFLPPVVAAEASTEREFRAVTANAPRDRRSTRIPLITYMRTVALAFAHAACDAVRAGRWPVTEIASTADDFIRRLGVHARYGLNFEEAWFSSLVDEAVSEVKRSEEWSEHLDERRALAENLCAGNPVEVDPPELAAECDDGNNRRAEVKTFIQSVRKKTGRRIKRKDIWSVAGYTEATEFERFQRGEGTAGSIRTDSRRLRRIRASDGGGCMSPVSTFSPPQFADLLARALTEPGTVSIAYDC